MKKTLLTLTCLTLAMICHGEEKKARRYNYYPEGRELVCRNGENRYTRALYGTHDAFRLETSDRPVFATYKRNECRNVSMYAVIDGNRVALDSAFFDCEARYMGGRRTYTLRHDDTEIKICAMASFREDEDAVWRFDIATERKDIRLEAVLKEARSSKFSRNGDLGVDDLTKFNAKEDGEPLSVARWNADGTSFMLLEGNKKLVAAEWKGKDYDRLKQRFESEEEKRTEIMSRVEINTPDALFNTLGSILMAAADGLWDGKTWLHGCIGWRTPLAGWRGCYVGDAVGWTERSYSHFKAYGASQVTDVTPVTPHPSQDSTLNLARAKKKWGTQMYSNGYICRYPERKDVMHHYDMNLNYIDGLLWHLSYNAGKEQLREFWQILTRHLEWEKRNFDPDNDCLYDAYCCIWASDALYYNGGAVTHSSAYNYRGNRLAARIAEILGEDGEKYRREAEGILKAMNRRLWIEERGHWAEYEDLMGKGRKHESAALWSVYTPIDCGACSPEQAFRATEYVDREIPHIPVVAEGGVTVGHTLSTTDWMPYAWSTNNVAHEEVANMALAYFQAGRTEKGFELLKTDLTDEMLLGKSPGNFGQISFYDRERKEAYRDFGDNIGITSRAIINGLFGITPDALYGRCIIKPAFPEEWREASIRTPYLSYSFRREGDKDIYEIEQNFAEPLQIVIRTNAGEGAYIDTEGCSKRRQTIVVERKKLPQRKADKTLTARKEETTQQGYIEKMGLGEISLCQENDKEKERHVMLDLSRHYNAKVTDIFKNRYESPRPPFTTLQIPVQGIGEWCHPKTTAEIDDSGLRNIITAVEGEKGLGIYDTEKGIRFLLAKEGSNVVFSSLWDNYPDEVRIPLRGLEKGFCAAYLMMIGTTNNMQSRIDNGLVIAEYADNTCDTLHLVNPINWQTITEEFVFDDYAFWSAPVSPLRFRLDNGKVGRDINKAEYLTEMPLEGNEEKKIGEENRYAIHHGAGVILKMPVNNKKKLKAVRLVTLSNDIVIGIMGITLEKGE